MPDEQPAAGAGENFGALSVEEVGQVFQFMLRDRFGQTVRNEVGAETTFLFQSFRRSNAAKCNA